MSTQNSAYTSVAETISAYLLEPTFTPLTPSPTPGFTPITVETLVALIPTDLPFAPTVYSLLSATPFDTPVFPGISTSPALVFSDETPVPPDTGGIAASPTPQPVPTSTAAVITAAPTLEPGLEAELGWERVRNCSGLRTQVIRVNNTSMQDFESARLRLDDPNTGRLIGIAITNFPFSPSAENCPPGESKLESGKMGFVAVSVFENLPQNRALRFSAQLCTGEDLTGSCLELTLDKP